MHDHSLPIAAAADAHTAPARPHDLRARSQCAPARGPYHALGHHFAVSTTDPALDEHLTRLFAAFAVDGPLDGTHHYSVLTDREATSGLAYRLYRDGQHLVSTRAPDLVLAQLLWHLNRAVIDETAEQLLVHAGAASYHGRALVLPAPMESGKTTLVAGLVRHGFDYLSDEAAAIDPHDLRLVAFPRALSIDEGSWEVLRELRPHLSPQVAAYQGSQWQVPPDAIRPGAVAADATPAFVISIRYRRDAPTRLSPMSRAEAVKELAEHAFNLPRFGDRGLWVLAELARRSSCHRLLVGDLEEACELLTDLVDGR